MTLVRTISKRQGAARLLLPSQDGSVAVPEVTSLLVCAGNEAHCRERTVYSCSVTFTYRSERDSPMTHDYALNCTLWSMSLNFAVSHMRGMAYARARVYRLRCTVLYSLQYTPPHDVPSAPAPRM